MMIRHVAANSDLDEALATNGLLASYKQLLLSDEVLRAAVSSLPSRPPELQDSDQTAWPETLRKMLQVSFEPDENILEVSCQSRDPESTVNVIDALREASRQFIEDDQSNIQRRLYQNLEENQDAVEDEIEQLYQQLTESRKAIGEISTVDGSEGQHPVVARVSNLSSELTEARSQHLQLQASYRIVSQTVSAGQDLSQLIPIVEKIRGPGALARIPGLSETESSVITQIESDLAETEATLQALSQHLGSRNPRIVRLKVEQASHQRRLSQAQQANRNRFSGRFYDQQIAQWMLNTVAGELSRMAHHEQLLRSDYEQARTEALALSDQLSTVQMAEQRLESLQLRHKSLLDRLNSIDLSQINSSFHVTRLNNPILPRRPVAPVLSQILILAIMLGSIGAFATIFVIDLIDDRLRSPEEVQNQLGLPILGVIRPLPEEDDVDHNIYVHGHPLSVETECFRTIRTAIALAESDTRCIAVTSSEQSEGKTTLTSNLAATFAQTGSRTLLIDADMRRPGLSKMLEIRGQGGLSEILRANENVAQMCRERIVSTEVNGLDVLPCGPRMMNAGVLLSMPSLAETLDWAVSEYDQVMVDCPPTLPVSDAAIVGNYVDGLVFLLNPDKTHRRSALRAVEQLRSVGMNLIGVVTNTSSEVHSGSYGYGYGYGYGQEYTYGHDDEPGEYDDDTVVSVAFEQQRATAGREVSVSEHAAVTAATAVPQSVAVPEPTPKSTRYALLSDSSEESSRKAA